MRRSRCCSTHSICQRPGMEQPKRQTNKQYVAQGFSPAISAAAGLTAFAKASAVKKSCATFFVFVLVGVCLAAQAQDETTTLLQQYVRIDTSNPPGHTTKAADFLAGVLQREGIAVTRYESAPGRAVVLARLQATGWRPAGKAS